jgi:hypothetical protein
VFGRGLLCIISRFYASATTLEKGVDTAVHKGYHDNSFAKKPSRDKRTCHFAVILANLAGLQVKRQKGDVHMLVTREVGGVRGMSAKNAICAYLKITNK